MTAIPYELLHAIANPSDGNVLQKFAAGQQQGYQNQQRGREDRRYNALLEAGSQASAGNYQGAAATALGAGEHQIGKEYISMAAERRRDAELNKILNPSQVQGPPSPNAPPMAIANGTEPQQAPFSQATLAKARKALQIGGREAAQKVLMESLSGAARPPTAEEKAMYPNVVWMDGKGEPHFDSGTNVTIENIPLKGQTKEEEVAGTKRGERVDALESGKTIQNLQQLRYIGKQMEGLNTGPLSGAQMTAGAFMSQLGASPETLKDFGIDPNLVTTGPQLQALINRQVVGMIGSGQFPAQNFSDTDRIFLEKIFPSLSNVPGANALITATTERMIQIEEAKLQAWYDASDNGTTFRDFERQWNRQLSQMDVFGDIAKEAQALGGTSDQPQRRRYNPATGKLE